MIEVGGVSHTVEAWEQAYLRFETPEEEIRKFTRRFARLGQASWPRDARVLSLFCGRGNEMAALERLGFTSLRGVDLSERLVRLYSGPGRCFVGDCLSLPVRSGSQDIAVVQGGLHHLPDLEAHLPLAVAEVHRVLKPGGRFVVVEPWQTPFLRFVDWVGHGPLRNAWGKLDALTTMNDYEGATYRRWLASPDVVLSALARRFATERCHQQWGKLLFVGRRESGAA
jgi:SAM-dependent methyltransferase